MHASPPRKFSECAARFLIRPGSTDVGRTSRPFSNGRNFFLFKDQVAENRHVKREKRSLFHGENPTWRKTACEGYFSLSDSLRMRGCDQRYRRRFTRKKTACIACIGNYSFEFCPLHASHARKLLNATSHLTIFSDLRV